MKLSILFLSLIVVLGFLLRFYKLDTNPPSIYIDEVSIGVDAYSILKTGHDQHGAFMPMWFESLGDYKMPGYIYAVSASMVLFGKNEFAIRFPSALAGSLTVLLLYFFLVQLGKMYKTKTFVLPAALPLIASFLLAISPWHIQFSRGGFEVNLALFLYMLGLNLSVLALSKNKKYFLIGAYIALVASSYTYHSFRVLVPITLIAISYLVYSKFITFKREAVMSLLISIVLLLPLFIFSVTAQGEERFAQTSAFTEYVAPNLIDKIMLYPLVVVKDYLTFFSTHFLFNFGDGIGRHQIPSFGLIPRWEFIFLVLGIFFITRNFRRSFFFWIVLFLLVLAPLPASIARPSPHSLRALLMVIPITIITALGIASVFQHMNYLKKIIIVGFLLFGIYEFSYYLHYYYAHYPKVNSRDWGASYKETVLNANNYQKSYSHIIVDKNLDGAPSYFAFYSDSVKPIMVNEKWRVPKSWGRGKVLLIRPYYGPSTSKEMIKQIKLPQTSDVFAEFWELSP